MENLSMTDYLPWLLEKYGPRLYVEDIATILRTSPQGIRNLISANRLPIPTAKEGEGRSAPRYADARDVATYLEESRPKAA